MVRWRIPNDLFGTGILAVQSVGVVDLGSMSFNHTSVWVFVSALYPIEVRFDFNPCSLHFWIMTCTFLKIQYTLKVRGLLDLIPMCSAVETPEGCNLDLPTAKILPLPRHSMYAIYAYIDPPNHHPN